MSISLEWILLIVYAVILIVTVIRILLYTPSTPKTLAYLVLVFAVPIAGIVLYYAVGRNFRHKKSRLRISGLQREFDQTYLNKLADPTEDLLAQNKDKVLHYEELVHFLSRIGREYLTHNRFKLLINGEQKFPEMLACLESAEHFIHMEYYAWENDVRGNQIKDVLIRKAAEGVKVRVIYDDYASRSIKKNIVRELKEGGISVFPQIKVKLRRLANRINHRDHRKIIIIDGKIGFVGGINLSDRYDNSIDTGLYWRDTHVKFTGALVHSIQRHFLISWNACQPEKLEYTPELFPKIADDEITQDAGTEGLAQIVAGGPVYRMSNIMLSYVRIFTLARSKLYITNPYFIPSESILDALKQAALSGVDVRLILPDKPDSAIVGAASRFYFETLLEAGVRIFLYSKGFVHAKTVVADQLLSVVGTANMDIRSFDLNFEIMSVIHSSAFAGQMEAMFLDDLKDCAEVTLEEWEKIGAGKRLVHSVARLISSFL